MSFVSGEDIQGQQPLGILRRLVVAQVKFHTNYNARCNHASDDKNLIF